MPSPKPSYMPIGWLFFSIQSLLCLFYLHFKILVGVLMNSSSYLDDFYGDEQRTFRQRPFSLTNINSVNSNTIIPNRVRPRIQSCTDVNGFKGVCVRNLACTANGGRPSGGCGLGRTCCVSK